MGKVRGAPLRSMGMKSIFNWSGGLKRAVRLIAFVLAAFALASLCGCSRGGDVVVDIFGTESATASPTAEAAPVLTEEPTADPTAEPTDEPTESPVAEPTDAVQPAQNGRKVYLTFDDGPTKATPEVLDILKRYNAKATFFTVGRMVKANPDTARRILEEGHVLGCHTQTHDFDKIYKSPAAFVSDVDDWRETVKNVVGYDAGAYVYRFPGGSNNASVGGKKGRGAYVAAMNEHGYYTFDWNLALNDAWLAGNKDHLPVKEYLWNSYLETYSWYKNVDPLILIIHDTRPESVELLPQVLDDLVAKGFTFGLCTELDGDYLM